MGQHIEQRTKQIIAERLDVDLTEVTNDASFVNDLNADSLDTVELLMALEEEFNIQLSDQEAEKIVTVQQAIELVQVKIAQNT